MSVAKLVRTCGAARGGREDDWVIILSGMCAYIYICCYGMKLSVYCCTDSDGGGRNESPGETYSQWSRGRLGSNDGSDSEMECIYSRKRKRKGQ